MKQKFMPHFAKVMQLKQITNKGLINYCKNAGYYNTTPSLSIKEGRKEKEEYIYKQKRYNIQTIQNKTNFTHEPPRSLV